MNKKPFVREHLPRSFFSNTNKELCVLEEFRADYTENAPTYKEIRTNIKRLHVKSFSPVKAFVFSTRDEIFPCVWPRIHWMANPSFEQPTPGGCQTVRDRLAANALH